MTKKRRGLTLTYDEKKELIKTGTIEQIQEALDNGEFDVKGGVLASDLSIRIPYAWYAMVKREPAVLERFLKKYEENDDIIDLYFYTRLKGEAANGYLVDTTMDIMDFAVGGYYKILFCFDNKKMQDSLEKVNMLLEHHDRLKPRVFHGNFHGILKNMRENIEEYVPLFLDHGATFVTIDNRDGHRLSLFETAAENLDPRVFTTLVKEAKKRLSPEIFLDLLLWQDNDGKTIEDHFEPDSLLCNYWKEKGPKLINKLETATIRNAKSEKVRLDAVIRHVQEMRKERIE